MALDLADGNDAQAIKEAIANFNNEAVWNLLYIVAILWQAIRRGNANHHRRKEIGRAQAMRISAAASDCLIARVLRV